MKNKIAGVSSLCLTWAWRNRGAGKWVDGWAERASFICVSFLLARRLMSSAGWTGRAPKEPSTTCLLCLLFCCRFVCHVPPSLKNNFEDNCVE